MLESETLRAWWRKGGKGSALADVSLKASTVAADEDWHHTDDYGRLEADGVVGLVGRKNGALRQRAENASSIELATADLVHPAMRDVAVGAVPPTLAEDEIEDFVMPEPGQIPEAERFSEFFDAANGPYVPLSRPMVVDDELLTFTQSGRSPVTTAGRAQESRQGESRRELLHPKESLMVGLSINRDERMVAAT